jgi:hypothetical protein
MCSGNGRVREEILSEKFTFQLITYILISFRKQWKCLECQHILTAEYVENILKDAKEKISQAGFDIKEIERQISNFSTLLNPNHWLIVEAKQNLAALLRSICMLEDNVKQPPKKYLQRKLELCEELIPILRVVTPGISRFTGKFGVISY